MDSSFDLEYYIDRCWPIFFAALNVWCLQGDISQQDKRATFLTVHDLGCNRKYSYKTLLYFNKLPLFFFLIYLMTSLNSTGTTINLPSKTVHRSDQFIVQLASAMCIGPANGWWIIHPFKYKNCGSSFPIILSLDLGIILLFYALKPNLYILFNVERGKIINNAHLFYLICGNPQLVITLNSSFRNMATWDGHKFIECQWIPLFFTSCILLVRI